MHIKISIMSIIFVLLQIELAIAAGVTTIAYPILVTVSANAIDLVAMIDPMNFGEVNLNESVFSNQPGGNPRCTIQNAGYADVNFTVSATIAGGWELGTAIDDVGPNRCVIAGIFTQPITTIDLPNDNRDLIESDFGDNDVLGSVPVLATTDSLARDNDLPDPDDGEYLKGYNVLAIPGQDIRSLRFMVQTPTQDDYATEQFFSIIIGAEIY